MNSHLTLGDFVTVEGSKDGIGKVVNLSADEIEVEYLVSPSGPEFHVVSVRPDRVRPAELPEQTRVYCPERKNGSWVAGRIVGPLVSAAAVRAEADSYPVRFPNDQERWIASSLLYVRWQRPLGSPIDYLAARVTETRYFYDGRSQLVRHLAKQRAAFGGLSGLASAAIELLEHQITTIRHILQDPVQRYLLADEVGLGKTMEACALVRQHLLESPKEARVLIVAPAHLAPQWGSELAEKFFLGDDPRIEVLDGAALAASAKRTFTMLVIDEAHQFARWAYAATEQERRDYEHLCGIAAQAPRVLLLSGTPVLNNEDGFLAMLHLLDPLAYPLSDREGFRRRVQERQSIAEILADLGDDASEYFIEDAIDRIDALFADDETLRSLTAAVRASLSGTSGDAGESRRALRTHISETYRIHRRMLRTRREDSRLADHLPRRTGVLELPCEDTARLAAFELLDAWRRAALLTTSAEHERAVAALFVQWIEAALAHPSVLLKQVDARLALLNRRDSGARRERATQRPFTQSEVFPGEAEFLSARRAALTAHGDEEPRAQQLVQWLTAPGKPRKAIVFVDSAEVADRVCQHLRQLLSETAVIRYTDHRSGLSFETDANLRALVCDASAEEGLNLQRSGAAVVHYDLPLAPTRIEQRIGRSDRIAARGRLINIVYKSAASYERHWRACLVDGIGIFNRSAAPLQYALAEATGRIRDQLFAEGAAAIDTEAARFRDKEQGLEKELLHIRNQEAIDALERDPQSDRAFFDRLQKEDEALEEKGRSKFEAWMVHRLQFDVYGERGSDIVRYVYSRRRPTLLPLSEVITRFRAAIDGSAERRARRDELSFPPCTFSRSVAESEHMQLMRIGHPLLESLASLLRFDERGCAFALWRVAKGWPGEPQLFFGFDFVIDADLSAAQALLGERREALHALRRQAHEVLRIEFHTVWLDGSLKPVVDPALVALLTQPYTQQSRGGSDTNLRSDRWPAVDAAVSASDWRELCIRASNQAMALVRSSETLQKTWAEAARRLEATGERARQQLRSRLARLSGAARKAEAQAADFEDSLRQALVQGVRNPTPRLDAVGAIYLAAGPLPDVERT